MKKILQLQLLFAAGLILCAVINFAKILYVEERSELVLRDLREKRKALELIDCTMADDCSIKIKRLADSGESMEAGLFFINDATNSQMRTMYLSVSITFASFVTAIFGLLASRKRPRI